MLANTLRFSGLLSIFVLIGCSYNTPVADSSKPVNENPQQTSITERPSENILDEPASTDSAELDSSNNNIAEQGVNYANDQNGYKSINFLTPTNYSIKHVSKCSFQETSERSSWKAVNNNANNADEDVDNCGKPAIELVVLPKIKKEGYSYDSFDALNTAGLSAEEKQKVESIIYSDQEATDSITTYLVNCMVDHGYTYSK